MSMREDQKVPLSKNIRSLESGERQTEMDDEDLIGVEPRLFRHFSLSGESTKSDESSPLLHHRRTIPNGTAEFACRHRAWKWYQQNLNQRPLETKAITSGSMTFVGDIIGQCIEHYHSQSDANWNKNGGNIDLVRLARFSTMGMFLQAPLTHYYYLALDHHLPPTPNPWTPTTLLKLVIDQAIYAPLFLLSVILYIGFLEGSSWYNIQEQLEDHFWETLVNNWKLWIPATAINMAYIPPVFRVLYCNIVFFFFSIYLSLALNNHGS